MTNNLKNEFNGFSPIANNPFMQNQALNQAPSHPVPNDGSNDRPIKFKRSGYDRFTRWADSHPKSAKAAMAGIALLLSPALLVAAPIAMIAGACHGVSSGHGAGKTLKNMCKIVASAFNFIVPARHEMATHVYTEREIEGVAKLRYEGDVPVLTLNSHDPIQSGRAQGLLLGDRIKEFLKAWDPLLSLAIPHPRRAQELCDHLKRVIPQQYIDEMSGIVEGFNERMVEVGSNERLNLDKLLMMQLVPDILHTIPNKLAKTLMPAPACTSILDKGNTLTGPTLMRNMDWPSLGLSGAATVMIRRKAEDGSVRMEVGTPGLAGIVTAMDNKGVALSMNVCLGNTQNIENGIPAIILNRMVMDNCRNIQEASTFVQQNRPLGPYHLSLADKKNVKAIHFYQAEDNQDYIRTVPAPVGHVATTNCRYNSEGPYMPYFHSDERQANIDMIYAQGGPSRIEVVKAALKAPEVNNNNTIQTVMMQPHALRMKVVFDNAYAADKELHEVSFEELL